MATRIDLPHGYRIEVEPGGWGVRSGEWSPVIGWYETLTEAVIAAAEHYARCLIVGSDMRSLAEASAMVGRVKDDFLADLLAELTAPPEFDN